MSDTHTDKLSEIMNVKEPITYDEQVKRIVACIADNKRTLVVKHHNQKYGGKFPLWVLIEFFSMGTLSYLYADLLTPDKKQIASASFNTSADCLQSWLRCLTDLRNRCAHYSRLYYWIFSAVPKTPQNAPYTFDRKLFSHPVTRLSGIFYHYHQTIILFPQGQAPTPFFICF